METVPAKKGSNRFYAIRKKNKDGSFSYSRGGSGTPSWGKVPKQWGLGGIKSHLHLFRISEYDFTLERESEAVKIFRHYGYKTAAERVSDYKLIPRDWPYWDCEVVMCDAQTFEILETHPAHIWYWQNALLPLINKSSSYLMPKIVKWCEKYKIELTK